MNYKNKLGYLLSDHGSGLSLHLFSGFGSVALTGCSQQLPLHLEEAKQPRVAHPLFFTRCELFSHAVFLLL